MKAKNVLIIGCSVAIAAYEIIKHKNKIFGSPCEESLQSYNDFAGVTDEFSEKNIKCSGHSESDRKCYNCTGHEHTPRRPENDKDVQKTKNEYGDICERVYDSKEDAEKEVDGVLQTIDYLTYSLDKFVDSIRFNRFKVSAYTDESFDGGDVDQALDKYMIQIHDPNVNYLVYNGKEWYWKSVCPEVLCLSGNTKKELNNSTIEGLMMAIEITDEHRRWAIIECTHDDGFINRVIIERADDI